MTFQPPPTAPEEPPQLSFTYSAIVTAVQTAQEKLPITGFKSEGYPVYHAKLNGHFLWDSPGSGNCDPDCPVGMIGRKMMLKHNGEENQKRKYLKLRAHTTNVNHLIILHHHQLHYPSTKKNLDGLQKIAKLKFFQISRILNHPYNLWLV